MCTDRLTRLISGQRSRAQSALGKPFFVFQGIPSHPNGRLGGYCSLFITYHRLHPIFVIRDRSPSCGNIWQDEMVSDISTIMFHDDYLRFLSTAYRQMTSPEPLRNAPVGTKYFHRREEGFPFSRCVLHEGDAVSGFACGTA